MRATKTAAENTIARIIHMVEEAQERKGRSQRFIERLGARYCPAVLLLVATYSPTWGWILRRRRSPRPS